MRELTLNEIPTINGGHSDAALVGLMGLGGAGGAIFYGVSNFALAPALGIPVLNTTTLLTTTLSTGFKGFLGGAIMGAGVVVVKTAWDNFWDPTHHHH